MNRNFFLTLVTVFTISSLATVSDGLAETRLEPTRNSFVKLGDIKGESMSAPLLGGVFMPNPSKNQNPIEMAVQQCCDEHTEVLFGRFNISAVIPGAGAVLADIAYACSQLRLNNVSDNEITMGVASIIGIMVD